MASTINASTSSGLVQTADTSGVLQLQTASTTAMTIDTSQNVGVGVTPSAWGSSNKAFQISGGGAVWSPGTADTRLSNNQYRDSASSRIYIATGVAQEYVQNSSGHIWYIAPSGTAGNAITFTQAMTLDNSGNLAVGTTSAVNSRLYVSNSGVAQLIIGYNNTGVNYFDADTQIFRNSAATERARIDSNGYLLVGYTSSNGAYKLQVNSQIFATSAIIATSDARYKTNVTPISNGLALINKLNPVSFDWKEHSVHDFDTKNTNVGFLAQDVQEVLKDEIYLNSVIRKNETELPDGTKEEFLGLSESGLIPILVKAIQEQQTLIQSLTERLTALENK